MRRTPDERFLAYAEARERHFARLALLTCAREPEAHEAVLACLTHVAAQWAGLAEDPEVPARRALFRWIVARTTREDPGPLLGLDGRQRAVLVVRFADGRSSAAASAMLGGSQTSLERETATALGALSAVTGRTVTDDDARRMLELAHPPVRDHPQGPAGWAAARARGRRRFGALVAAAGGLAAVLMLVSSLDAADPPPDASPSPTRERPAPRTFSLLRQAVDGTPYALANLPGRDGAGMPRSLGLPLYVNGFSTKVTDFVGSPTPETPVTMVLLRQLDDTTWFPALFFDATTAHHLRGLRLTSNEDRAGVPHPVLPMHGVSPDGRTVAFAQSRELVMLDVASGTTRRIALSGRGPRDVTWVPDSTVLRVHTDAGLQQVDLRAATVETLDPAAPWPHWELAMVDGAVMVQSIAAGGTLAYRQPVTAPVTAVGPDSASGSTGLVAASVELAPQWFADLQGYRYFEPARSNQALLAARADLPTARSLLVFPEGEEVLRQRPCCTVLAVVGQSIVIYLSRSTRGTWLAGWDMASGEVFGVTALRADQEVSLGPVSELP